MAKILMRHPLLAVVLLELVYDALIIASSLGLSALVPDLPGYSVGSPSQSLVRVLASAVGLLVLIGTLGWWRLAGFTPPARWRNLRLYWLPVVLLAAPLVPGVRPLPLDALGLLLVAYVATAVFEEGLWRGVMVGLLRPTGVWRAVLVSSFLFGLGHLGNSGCGASRHSSPLRPSARGCRVWASRCCACAPLPSGRSLSSMLSTTCCCRWACCRSRWSRCRSTR